MNTVTYTSNPNITPTMFEIDTTCDRCTDCTGIQNYEIKRSSTYVQISHPLSNDDKDRLQNAAERSISDTVRGPENSIGRLIYASISEIRTNQVIQKGIHTLKPISIDDENRSKSDFTLEMASLVNYYTLTHKLVVHNPQRKQIPHLLTVPLGFEFVAQVPQTSSQGIGFQLPGDERNAVDLDLGKIVKVFNAYENIVYEV